MNRELNHLVHKTDPLRPRQLIPIQDRPDVACSDISARQSISLHDIVIVQVCVEPTALGQVEEAVHRASHLPIDQRDRDSVLGDDIPWCGVAVPYGVRCAQAAPEPRPPYCIAR